MVQASQPIKKDTAPRAFLGRAEEWLLDNAKFNAYLDSHADVGKCNPIPTEWVEAAAMEAYTAFTETLDTWVETLIAGRPYDTPLVEWEHRELDKRPQQAAEMRAEMTR